jgi:phosphopantothenoylcysteine decarboxylase/phosphopantothenate--cysteine ligase
MAKLANGLADEMLSTTILASAAPLVLAPAMHHRMWAQPATQQNKQKLTERGVILVGPVEGRLASGEVGMGRFTDQEQIIRTVCRVLPTANDMSGLNVVVSAGGTREAIDPVRYLGNRSSGRMGHAIAAAAEWRGASVTLVTSSALPVPDGVDAVRVDSASEMADALNSAARAADIFVMAAAVADFRPRERAAQKIAKADVPDALALERNADILSSLRTTTGSHAVRVGFAAETHDVVAHAQEKLVAKGVDLVVANDVSNPAIGMGSEDNAVTIIGRDRGSIEVGAAPKEEIASRILDAALEVLRDKRRGKLVS